jgi:oligopeptide/dipeptide ABC transporter ATP-binding protein
MLQRVLIAMALACEPDVLIADEPSSSLDVTVQAQILDLLRQVQARAGSAMVLISHDLGVVADVADRVLVMYGGRAVECGAVDKVFEEPLHPYTRALIGCQPEGVPQEGGGCRPIAGQPPSLSDMPAGCAFHPRCDEVRDVCGHLVPRLAEHSGGHFAACHRLPACGEEPAWLGVDSQ